jgi:uncharacterized membrane protein
MDMNNKSQRQPPRKSGPTSSVAEDESSGRVTVQQQLTYQGAIPPPAMLREFDQITPGTAARLLDWAETEATHRREMERLSTVANVDIAAKQLEIAEYQSRATFRSDALGQLLGFIVCIACIAGAVWLGILGHAPIAVVLAAIPTAAIVQAFRIGMFRKPPSR